MSHNFLRFLSMLYFEKEKYKLMSLNISAIENAIDSGDFNGDGKTDIIIGNKILLGPFNYTQLLFPGDLYNLNPVKYFSITINNQSFSPNLIFNLEDINKDGKDDIGILYDKAYVIFGNINFNNITTLEVSTLNGNDGFTIYGPSSSNSYYILNYLSNLGDINKDGIDDFGAGCACCYLCGSSNAAGIVYIFFGKKTGWSSNIWLDNFSTISDISSITGPPKVKFGNSLKSVSDINNDGISDFYIGTSSTNRFVIYGRINWPKTIESNSMLQFDGFQIITSSSRHASLIGDFNNDGRKDILLDNKIILGRSTSWGTSINIETNASNLIKFFGSSEDFLLESQGVGDVNGDGLDDIVLVDSQADSLDSESGGRIYVIYGNKNFSNFFNVTASFTNNSGFVIYGYNKDWFTTQTDSAGGPFSLGCYLPKRKTDLNNDGLYDVVLTLPYGDFFGTDTGSTFVVWGNRNYTWSNYNEYDRYFDLAKITSFQGIIFSGPKLVRSPTNIGDINNDGNDDLLFSISGVLNVSVTNGVPNIISINGHYLIFGGKKFYPDNLSIFDIRTIRMPEQGIFLNNTQGSGVKAGDVNGDGIDDFLLSDSNRAVLIYGKNKFDKSNIDINQILNSDGVIFLGDFGGNYFPYSIVAGNIDINSDGKKDIIISAPYSSNNLGMPMAGKVYVVYGQNYFHNPFNLSGLSNGFIINGGFGKTFSYYNYKYDIGDILGSISVSDGDLNGDGEKDIVLVSTGMTDPFNTSPQPKVYLIFINSKQQYPFQIYLSQNYDYIVPVNIHASAIATGKINDDNVDDLIIVEKSTGNIYIIYGKHTWSINIDVNNLSIEQGFIIRTILPGSKPGSQIKVADLNRDNKLDLIVGSADFTNPNGPNSGLNIGQVFIIFSPYYQLQPLSNLLIIASMNAEQVLIINGIHSGHMQYGIAIGGDKLGTFLSIADINSDGQLDVLFSNFNIGGIKINISQGGYSFDITSTISDINSITYALYGPITQGYSEVSLHPFIPYNSTLTINSVSNISNDTLSQNSITATDTVSDSFNDTLMEWINRTETSTDTLSATSSKELLHYNHSLNSSYPSASPYTNGSYQNYSSMASPSPFAQTSPSPKFGVNPPDLTNDADDIGISWWSVAAMLPLAGLAMFD